MISEVYNEDNMVGMARYPDKFFDLAIVDPEYGIDAANMTMGKGVKKWAKSDWDKTPPSGTYFDELSRVSKRQIIWGGNYFTLPLTGGWVFWDKDRNKDISFSDGELAWTNFLVTLKKARIKYDGFLGADLGGKIHPTQKPVALYKWCLAKFANIGDKILDTHMGSQSSRIAAYNAGFDYYGWELDEQYFREGNKRFKEQTAQLQLL